MYRLFVSFFNTSCFLSSTKPGFFVHQVQVLQMVLLLSGLFLVKFLKNYLKLLETGIDDGKLKLFGGDGDGSNVGGRGG